MVIIEPVLDEEQATTSSYQRGDKGSQICRVVFYARGTLMKLRAQV
eukprot:CAMPEP_0185769772 /NCGR_PEP_ID=MMETSP1174-20130828/55855_1 /TAXON_ID=35687 /ORGANISM="Dictyocha speculum, Strain CCMP1381" /LENGTH=45 /DNA_ID= /DNA_START= /DNA_END= /DNA_ORIENTATION=